MNVDLRLIKTIMGHKSIHPCLWQCWDGLKLSCQSGTYPERKGGSHEQNSISGKQDKL